MMTFAQPLKCQLCSTMLLIGVDYEREIVGGRVGQGSVRGSSNLGVRIADARAISGGE
jgi:hypothetical protein